MYKFKADCIFTLSSAPIEKGVLIADTQGRIVEVIPPHRLDYEIADAKEIKGILLPGFINTHTHLELSYLKNIIKEKCGLDNFILEVQKAKTVYDKDEAWVEECMRQADIEMTKNGIVACCDISNTTQSVALKEKSRIHYHTFVEVYAFAAEKAEKAMQKGLKVYEAYVEKFGTQNVSLTPHSFYGASGKLISLITDFSLNKNSKLSLHHLESAEEIALFKNKSGNILKRLLEMGISDASFLPTGKRPLASVQTVLPPDIKTLLVHNTFADLSDVLLVNAEFNNMWWCFCPHSNLFIENTLPDFKMFELNTGKLTIGTDSYASNKSLSVLDELKTIQKKTDISTAKLLEWASLQGARFMDIDNTYGSFEKGKTPGILWIKHVEKKNAYALNPHTDVERLV